MRRTALLLVGLLFGLGLLTVVGYFGLNQVTRQWSEKDLRLRAELAVTSARQTLTTNWRTGSKSLAASLRDMTHDERIMGAAACLDDGTTLEVSPAYPEALSCDAVLARMKESNTELDETWTTMVDRPTGMAQVIAIPLFSGREKLGTVLVVQDLGYLTRREATTMYIVIAAFVTLAIGGSVLTLVSARLLWSRWTHELRQALADDEPGEFRPLARDVKRLVQSLDEERRQDAGCSTRMSPFVRSWM
jgi:trehalose 6-phosphate synthase